MGRWRSGPQYRRHVQGYRQQDHRLSRRQVRQARCTGEWPLSNSDNDTEEAINFEEMLASVREETPEAYVERSAADLEAVFDVPVRISVVLGRTKMAVSDLLKLDTGTVIELDRQVGEAVEIFINERLVARGEIVLVESKLGVTMTEIIKPQ